MTFEFTYVHSGLRYGLVEYPANMLAAWYKMYLERKKVYTTEFTCRFYFL